MVLKINSMHSNSVIVGLKNYKEDGTRLMAWELMSKMH